MKHIKKTIVLFAVALFCTLSFFATSLTAQAAEPVTYYVKYVESINEWRFQTGTWQDNGYHRELYYMQLDIKDGDLLVINGHVPFDLTVNVHLNNLTIVHSVDTVVTAKGIDNVYVLNGSTCAINGDVTSADVYEASVCNFNNNVGTLRILSEKEDILKASVAVLGTVDHLYAGGKSYKHYEFYSFAANSLRIENGALKTDKAKYSDTPSATPTTPSKPSNSDEYDDVPKTGDIRFNPLWLVCIAGVCLAGAYKLKKN